MEWGIIMSVFSVIGMLVLIFAEPKTDYQTFGYVELNPPTKPQAEPVTMSENRELKRAA